MQVLTRSSVKKTLALSSRKGEKKPTSRHQGPNLTRGITVAADQTNSIKNSWRERSSLHNTWKGTERKVLPPFRNLREGAPGDTPPSIPLVFLGLGVAGSCGDRPGDPGWRGPAQPLSALRSTASPWITNAASPLPSPSAPARWDLEAGGRRGGAGGRDGERRLCLPPPRRISTRNSRRHAPRPHKQHEQWAHRWWYTTVMWGQPHASRAVSERVRHCPRYAGTRRR